MAGVSKLSPLLVQVIRAEENYCGDESKAAYSDHDATKRIVMASYPRVGAQYNPLQHMEQSEHDVEQTRVIMGHLGCAANLTSTHSQLDKPKLYLTDILQM